jgi:hypothetical protein
VQEELLINVVGYIMQGLVEQYLLQVVIILTPMTHFILCIAE